MASDTQTTATDGEGLLAVITDIGTALGWTIRSFRREDELIILTALDQDTNFEQMIWVHDVDQGYVRCLLVWRGAITADQHAKVFELCARINNGLVFGCAEFSFHEGALLFRDSALLRFGPPADVLRDVTARLLELGSRYTPAVRATLDGEDPAVAVACIDEADRASTTH